MSTEQTTREVKLATMRGEKTGWDYRFDPGLLPPTVSPYPGFGGAQWSPDDWITFIGNNWFRKVQG